MRNYFKRQIEFSKIFSKENSLSEPTLQNVDKWLEIIEGDLSPENLSCDGEASQSSIRAKLAELNSAKNYCLKLKGVNTNPVPTKKVGDKVMFKGSEYTILKVMRANYRLVDSNGNQYTLKIGAL